MESTYLEIHVRVGYKIEHLGLPLDRRYSEVLSLTAWHTQYISLVTQPPSPPLKKIFFKTFSTLSLILSHILSEIKIPVLSGLF